MEISKQTSHRFKLDPNDIKEALAKHLVEKATDICGGAPNEDEVKICEVEDMPDNLDRMELKVEQHSSGDLIGLWVTYNQIKHY